MSNIDTCPCDSGLLFNRCCGRYIKLGAYPQTAEQLMRSRFTAYTQCNIAYLKKTWHPSTYPGLDQEELSATHWLNLEVIATQPGLKKSIVEFKAYYAVGDQTKALHEVSIFKKHKNKWVYVDAAHLY